MSYIYLNAIMGNTYLDCGIIRIFVREVKSIDPGPFGFRDMMVLTGWCAGKDIVLGAERSVFLFSF